MAKNHNPPWTRDELILALDLYLSSAPVPNASHPTVSDLSEKLNALPIFGDSLDAFRSPSAVALKLANFQALDPAVATTGMQRGGRDTAEVWAELGDRQAEVAALAAAIELAANTGASAPAEGEDAAPEGRLLWRRHRAHERRRDLAKKKKELVLAQQGKLACEACQDVPEERYGDAGRFVLECHHRLPLAVGVARATRMKDLALLCASCHRAIHAIRPLPSVESFGATLK